MKNQKCQIEGKPTLEQCLSCGGKLEIIAAIQERPVIKKILTHLRSQARAPPLLAARGQAMLAA